MVVKYPDFSGSPVMVSTKNIRILVDQFKTLPFLSIRCSLYGKLSRVIVRLLYV